MLQSNLYFKLSCTVSKQMTNCADTVFKTFWLRQKTCRAVTKGLVSLAAIFVSSRNTPPQQMAAHIATAFLSQSGPITTVVLFSGTVFLPNYPFTCHPVIACILSYHSCGVKLSSRRPLFVLFDTLVLNKTDLKLLRFDDLSWVRIECDVHLKRYLHFLTCNSNDF